MLVARLPRAQLAALQPATLSWGFAPVPWLEPELVALGCGDPPLGHRTAGGDLAAGPRSLFAAPLSPPINSCPTPPQPRLAPRGAAAPCPLSPQLCAGALVALGPPRPLGGRRVWAAAPRCPPVPAAARQGLSWGAPWGPPSSVLVPGGFAPAPHARGGCRRRAAPLGPRCSCLVRKPAAKPKLFRGP